jgi:hypothetical protein
LKQTDIRIIFQEDNTNPIPGVVVSVCVSANPPVVNVAVSVKTGVVGFAGFVAITVT